MNQILIEAGDFKQQGGWKLDTQFIETMGAPYLLAHGLGTPVENAYADFEVNEAAQYYIYVYTYNWVAPWHEDMAPGIFELKIDGEKINHVFGKETSTWGWESVNPLYIETGKHVLSLHDCTGFEGRMGIVLLSTEKRESLPTEANKITEMIFESYKTRKKSLEQYDMVVCGGGIAGICTALSSARNGLKTALVQDRFVVGGNNSSEVRVWLGGETHFEPFPGIGNIVNEMEQKRVGHYGASNQGENYEDSLKMDLLKKEENLTLYMGHILKDVVVENNQIKKVVLWDYVGKKVKEISGTLFCDSTGDGTLGYKAGADFEVTTNGHMGMTNCWYVEKCEKEEEFPKCPWAINLEGVDFPGKVGVKDVYDNELDASLGCWFWESGCELDPIEKAEYARDMNFRAMYGAWDTLRNVEKTYEDYRLGYCSYIGGKRESRRLFGDVILTKSDVSKDETYVDGCVPSTWNFDVHYPDRRFYEAFREGDAFITKDYHERFKKPFFIPYRALYSRNVNNMFMAGRDISVSHDALGTARVMRTGGMMGEVIGYAAKMCRDYEILPREIYEQHLEEFINNLKSIPNLKKNKLVANVHEV